MKFEPRSSVAGGGPAALVLALLAAVFIPSETPRAEPGAPELVVLPAGSYYMGSAPAQDAYHSEKPVHEVNIRRPFAMMKYEVTFADYDRYADATANDRPLDEGWGRGNRPVINVSWEDAQAYATWLSQQTGQTYRLPTEAEWEYAARAGTTTTYSWGDSASCEDARYGRTPKGDCSNSHDGTVPVGSFAANPWGLHDMHGNAQEWVQDCYHENYEQAPGDGSAWENNCLAVSGTPYRVFRGGSWGDNVWALRSRYRDWAEPSDRNPFSSFRLVREIGP